MHRALTAHTPLGEKWWAVSLTGREALSEPFVFHLELDADDPNIDTQALIGEVAGVELEAQNGLVRWFSGQIVRASAQGRQGRHWRYKATLAPKLWHASRRSDFRIWQNLTIPAIANDVLEANALRYEWRLKNTYKTWEYLVQYDETDQAFLCRLLEHEGIYYWFEHGAQGETLILGDHFTTHETFGGYETIPFYPPDIARPDEDHYFEWSAAREPEPGRYAHRDYDFKRPSKDLATDFADPRGHLFDQYEIYSYPGHYIEPGDGRAYATVRLEALQRGQDVIELAGRVRGAVPGRRFGLRNHPRATQNRDYLIVSAHYEAHNNLYEGNAGTENADFHVIIDAIPADRQYRPPQKTLKPRTRGPETAVVVGPAGHEIHTDQYGRVKVHFHWDRYGKKDGQDSCWIRVSYPWAGSNFGGIHIPRIGQEVIVDFERGDPDRPLITGRVYNAEQMPPWELPANSTQSGILTRSSRGGTPDNANALRFEDEKGHEQVWLHAERNQDIEVERDESHWVGQDRRKTIDRDETTIIHRHRTETVDANEKITIHQHRKKTVDLTETALIGLIKTETVGVANIDSVGSSRATNVGMAYGLNVGMLMNTLVGGQQSTQVGATKSLEVGETYEVSVGETMKLNVGKQFEIVCGGARLVLTSDGGIHLQGKHLEFIGASAINGDAAMIQWNCGAAQSASGGEGAGPTEDIKTEAPEVADTVVAPEAALEKKNVIEADPAAAAFTLAGGGLAQPAPAGNQPNTKTSAAGANAPASPLNDPAVKALIDKSPSLKASLKKLKDDKWQVQYGPHGGGSTTLQDDSLIIIDGKRQGNPAEVVRSLSHEVGHAQNPLQVDTSSKAAFVNSYLNDEGAATLNNIKVQREIVANGGPNIGISGNAANHAAYNAAYNKYGDSDAARNAIGSIYGSGEKTSNTGQTYQDYYGSQYDNKYGASR